MTNSATTGGTGPRVLVVATKCPWPPTDGGRLVLAATLRALADGGARITLVSPPPPGVSGAHADGGDPSLGAPSPRFQSTSNPAADDRIEHVRVPRHVPSWTSTLLHASTPATIVRQTNPSAFAAVERLVAERAFDVAHAEQLHSLPALEPARRQGIPIVLRAQNVESDLWAGAARALPFAAPWLLMQAALLRRYEGRAVARAAVTAALTAPDAARLRRLAGDGGNVVEIAAPFPAALPAGPTLPGHPAIVVAGGGWIPNRDGARWFVRSVWPQVHARLPDAHLHLFTDDDAVATPRAATRHPLPGDAIALFPAGAIHLVPLRVASGIRMKILEAWARGVPVIATSAAAAGLAGGDRPALLEEETPQGLALAVETLARDAVLRDELVREGRRRLGLHHDPAAIGERWIDLYRAAAP